MQDCCSPQVAAKKVNKKVLVIDKHVFFQEKENGFFRWATTTSYFCRAPFTSGLIGRLIKKEDAVEVVVVEEGHQREALRGLNHFPRILSLRRPLSLSASPPVWKRSLQLAVDVLLELFHIEKLERLLRLQKATGKL